MGCGGLAQVVSARVARWPADTCFDAAIALGSKLDGAHVRITQLCGMFGVQDPPLAHTLVVSNTQANPAPVGDVLDRAPRASMPWSIGTPRGVTIPRAPNKDPCDHLRSGQTFAPRPLPTPPPPPPQPSWDGRSPGQVPNGLATVGKVRVYEEGDGGVDQVGPAAMRTRW